MKTSVALSMLLLLAAAPPVAAEPVATALTLDDCLRLAVDHQPLLTAVEAGVSAATEAVGEARAPYWPQVDFSAGYHRWQRRAFLPSGLTLPGLSIPKIIGPLDDWTGGLSSRVTLFDFGERRAGLEAARAQLGSAQADAAATRGDVRLSVQSAFYALAAAQELLEVAERNLEANRARLTAEVDWVEGDAFEILRDWSISEAFDAIVLDPPAFAKTKRAVEGALRGYKELNLRALRMLRPGGLLVTCSCSHHVSWADLEGSVASAAADAGRRVRLLERRGAAPDHPVVLNLPETEYLKCLVLEVE